MARLFSKSQKFVMEQMTGRSGDADHIIPWSKGGETTINNMQLIPKGINSVKGVFKYEPRGWQCEFSQKFQQRSGESFLLVATPGSGKTKAALHECQRWRNLTDGRMNRIVWVVPTDNLRTTLIREAHLFGLHMSDDPFLKEGYDGCVITYQGLDSSRLYLSKVCQDFRVMLVADEVHHCGERNRWGDYFRDAFKNAKVRLMMSGTPARTDGTPIPFIRYNSDGWFEPDFHYSYSKGIADRVVREVAFLHQTGMVELNGNTFNINKTCSESEEEQLGCLVSSKGQFACEMIRRGSAELERVRSSVSDAAALVVVSDMLAAERIADIIQSETGDVAHVIVSDDNKATTSVEAFRKSSAKWLVAVQMISEGTDIPRLQVLVWLTNKKTRLVFRQIVGRIVRARLTSEMDEGVVVLPETPTFCQFATDMRQEVMLGIQERNESDEKREYAERQRSDLLSFSTAHTGAGVAIVGEKTCDSREHVYYTKMATEHKIPVGTAQSIVAWTRAHPLDAERVQHVDDIPMQERENQLRVECSRLVNRLVRLTGKKEEVAQQCSVIHGQYKKQYKKSQDEMSVVELTEKRDDLKRRIREETGSR